MRLLRRCVLPVLMVFFMLAGVSCEKADAVKHFAKGNEYLEEGMLDEAISENTEAIEKAPEFYFAYVNRGIIYSKKYHYDRAISDFTKAIEIDPENTKAYFNRGATYEKRRQYDRAVSEYTKIIEIDPKANNAYLLRGGVYMIKLNEEMKGCADWSMLCDLGDCNLYNIAKEEALCR